jgi:hypothetical protein
MTNSTPVIKDPAPRRSFFGHLGGAVVLGLAGFLQNRCMRKHQRVLTVLTGLER